jgi:hypothetical protein
LSYLGLSVLGPALLAFGSFVISYCCKFPLNTFFLSIMISGSCVDSLGNVCGGCRQWRSHCLACLGACPGFLAKVSCYHGRAKQIQAMCYVFLEDEQKVFEERRETWVREFGKKRKRDEQREMDWAAAHCDVVGESEPLVLVFFQFVIVDWVLFGAYKITGLRVDIYIFFQQFHIYMLLFFKC